VINRIVGRQRLERDVVRAVVPLAVELVDEPLEEPWFLQAWLVEVIVFVLSAGGRCRPVRRSENHLAEPSQDD
jgi:hypothetical protein